MTVPPERQHAAARVRTEARHGRIVAAQRVVAQQRHAAIVVRGRHAGTVAQRRSAGNIRSPRSSVRRNRRASPGSAGGTRAFTGATARSFARRWATRVDDMAEGPRDIHDSGFKLLFDHADMVRDLLRGFVPADIVGDFDFASPRTVPYRPCGRRSAAEPQRPRVARALPRRGVAGMALPSAPAGVSVDGGPLHVGPGSVLHGANLAETDPQRRPYVGRPSSAGSAGGYLQRLSALVGAFGGA